MTIEIRHLRTLAALAASGSLAQAAERVHLTQSALSHQLRTLEDHYGVTLLHRGSRPIRLTPAGERLLALAQEVLPALEQVEHSLLGIAAGRVGRLYVTIECHACFDWLLPLLEDFRQRWLEVEIDIRTPDHFDALPALIDGDIDLVITSDPIERPGLEFQPLFHYCALLAMPTDHPLVERDWIRPQDLADQALITYPVPQQRLDIFTHFLDPAGVTPAQVRQCELTAVLLQLVASRRGLAALPDWVLRPALEADRLAARPLGPQGMGGRMYAAVRTTEAELPWLADFIALATAAGR